MGQAIRLARFYPFEIILKTIKPRLYNPMILIPKSTDYQPMLIYKVRIKVLYAILQSMSLKPLIKGQKIIIDDHKRGNKEVKNWDDPSIDIHIDKRTKTKIDGKVQEVVIKVPVNSNREIEIRSAKKQVPIPRMLQKEIEGAFKNQSVREQFIYDIVETLRNFSSYSSTKERAIVALKKISKHFELAWDDDEVRTFYTNTMYNRYVKEVVENGKLYRISIDGEKLEVEEV